MNVVRDRPGSRALLTTRFGHGLNEELFQCIAYSPNGRMLATAEIGKKIKLWDTATGQLKATLSLPNITCALAFSPDSKTLASAGDDPVVRLWDVEAGKLVKSLPDHADTVFALTFARDGRLISADGGGKERFWDIHTGMLLETRPLPTNHPSQFVHASNGHMLLAGYMLDANRSAQGEPEARVWDLDSGKLLAAHQLVPAEGAGYGAPLICLSKNGAWLACAVHEKSGSPWKVQVWDIKRDKKPVSMQSKALFPLTFSPDERSLVLGDGVYDVRTGKRNWPQSSLENGSWLVGAYSPGGKMLAIGRYDHSLVQLDAGSGRLLRSSNGAR